MPKLVPINSKLFIKLLLKLGFEMRDAAGSHMLLRHVDGRIIVVPVHNNDLGRGLLRKMLRQINLSVEEYDVLRKQV